MKTFDDDILVDLENNSFPVTRRGRQSGPMPALVAIVGVLDTGLYPANIPGQEARASEHEDTRRL